MNWDTKVDKTFDKLVKHGYKEHTLDDNGTWQTRTKRYPKSAADDLRKLFKKLPKHLRF